MVKIDANAVTHWDDEEGANRWLRIFTGPLLMHRYLAGVELTNAELKCVADLIVIWRDRLANLSWFMRCINEPIATRAALSAIVRLVRLCALARTKYEK